MKHIKPYKIFESVGPNFPTTRDGVIELCREYEIENYTINDDLSIDTDGSIDLSELPLDYLPLRFNYIGNSFECDASGLKTLEGCPKTVDGHFHCYNNKLTDLEHFPEINGNVHIDENAVYYLVHTFIKNGDNFMIEDFVDYEIVRNRDTVMLDRLQTFIKDNDLEMPDLEDIKKHYKIIE
jgi:hypothetical protein